MGREFTGTSKIFESEINRGRRGEVICNEAGCPALSPASGGLCSTLGLMNSMTHELTSFPVNGERTTSIVERLFRLR